MSCNGPWKQCAKALGMASASTQSAATGVLPNTFNNRGKKETPTVRSPVMSSPISPTYKSGSDLIGLRVNTKQGETAESFRVRTHGRTQEIHPPDKYHNKPFVVPSEWVDAVDKLSSGEWILDYDEESRLNVLLGTNGEMLGAMDYSQNSENIWLSSNVVDFADQFTTEQEDTSRFGGVEFALLASYPDASSEKRMITSGRHRGATAKQLANALAWRVSSFSSTIATGNHVMVDRCQSCGQFVSPVGNHVCNHTSQNSPLSNDALDDRRVADISLAFLFGGEDEGGVEQEQKPNELEGILSHVRVLGEPPEGVVYKPPHVGASYTMDEQTESLWRSISASLQISQEIHEKDPEGSEFRAFRAFTLLGPKGTGKSEFARRLAHHTGVEMTAVTAVGGPEDIIGGVVIESDGKGGTRTAQKLGPVGQAAVRGGVVLVDEIVRARPNLASAMQDMIEKGEFTLPSAEGGRQSYKVHPNTVFVFTANPGYEGDADRPPAAFTSRTGTYVLNAPTAEEMTDRLTSWSNAFLGTSLNTDEKKQRSYHGQSRTGYKIKTAPSLTQRDLTQVGQFWDALRNATTGEDRTVGINSFTPTDPSAREMKRFVAIGAFTGNWKLALEQLKVICDQSSEEFEEQWNTVQGLFNQFFPEQFGG